MTVEMIVSLSLEKARQHLLKYFETRDDIKVKVSKPNSVQVSTSGWKHPWIKIKIGIFGEEGRTRLAFNFDFLKVYAIVALVTLGVIALVWVFAVNTFEATLISTIIGIMSTITLLPDLRKTKRKFLDDIRKAFALLNKTDV